MARLQLRELEAQSLMSRPQSSPNRPLFRSFGLLLQRLSGLLAVLFVEASPALLVVVPGVAAAPSAVECWADLDHPIEGDSGVPGPWTARRHVFRQPGDGKLFFVLEVRKCRVLEPPHRILCNGSEEKDCRFVLYEELRLRNRDWLPVISDLGLQGALREDIANTSVPHPSLDLPARKDAGLGRHG